MGMRQDSLVRMDKLVKIYGQRLVFKNITLDVHAHDSILLTGANGAGKSTLLKILAGLSTPTGGSITRKPSLRLAYLGHDTFIYPDLTALENLRFWQNCGQGKQDDGELSEILRMVDLLPFAHEKSGIFSRGMAQRLNFGRVLLGSPEIFLLDEPFTGMDTPSYALVTNIILDLKKQGAAILLVSHSPEQDKILCDAIYNLEKNGLKAVPPVSRQHMDE